MMQSPQRRAPEVAIAIAAAACIAPFMASAGDSTRVREWHFRVLLDGKPVGRHDFTVTGTDEAAEVVSRARFVVTVLRIPVYRYVHDDRELWKGGCLANIDASTDDNGRGLAVRGEAAADGFHVLGGAGAHTWQGCVRSFAYWDRRILASQRLLNAQTGEYEPVQVTRAAASGEVPGASEHDLLEGEHFRIELWYRASGEWCALESRTKDGKRLRYEIES